MFPKAELSTNFLASNRLIAPFGGADRSDLDARLLLDRHLSGEVSPDIIATAYRILREPDRGGDDGSLRVVNFGLKF